MQQLRRREAGVKDQRTAHGCVIELSEEGAEHRGLAGADFTCKEYEPGMVVDAVEEVGKGLLMVFAQENKAGVWGYGKRFFLESVKVTIHGFL